jgi:hypothetical protein
MKFLTTQFFPAFWALLFPSYDSDVLTTLHNLNLHYYLTMKYKLSTYNFVYLGIYISS